MTRRIAQQILTATAEIVAPPVSRACTDHSFELPTGIYLVMALLFAGSIAVLAIAFRSDMALPYAIVFAFLIAFFAIPTIFVRTSPRDGAAPLGWSDFRATGIATATGRTGALEATTLVLILPVLLMVWAIAIAIIAATVG
ncbi:MAG: hypothetical protein ABIS38_02750 [Sphingomicrobium sp.]